MAAPTESTAPSPTPPPKPTKASSARIEGKYRITLFLVSSQIQGLPTRDKSTWRVSPTCDSGGQCDVIIQSSNKWSKRAIFIQGKYRLARNIRDAFTCDGSKDPGVYEYGFFATDMDLIDNEWTATGLSGTFVERTVRGCGFDPPGVAGKYAIRGHLTG
jgi:hypothetical protein